MVKRLAHYLTLAFIVLSLSATVVPVQAQGGTPPAGELIERGRYLATIAGCEGCHTPVDENFIAIPGRAYAGGYPFPLGPLGTVFTKNLTPDKETGLGDWTDEEIKRAMQSGVSKDGLHLFPIMPYRFYNRLADEDVNAIIAYLRSLPPIKNQVPRQQILPVEQLPELPRQSGIVAPSPTDTAARGRYLMTALIACTDCHTPVDPATGAPIMEKYLAGGQPYEGPWGIVYSANLTPHATGIGSRTDEDINRVLHSGILRPDPANPTKGRRAILMPWRDFVPMTADDTKALIHYLRNDVKPVDNQVPAAALKPEFIELVDIPMDQPTTPTTNSTWIIGLVVSIVVLGLIAAFLVFRTRKATA